MIEHKTYPFITVIEHNERIYYGIIKIKSKQYISLYCFQEMSAVDQEALFGLGKQWWWQSNRMIPISLYMQGEMDKYEKYVKRFNTDSVKLITGPLISLSDLPTKRVKRRNLALKADAQPKR